jgi:peptide/nickel transport system permease protein
MATTAAEGVVSEQPDRRPLRVARAWSAIWWFARKKPLGAFGALIVLVLLFFATFADARVVGSSAPLLAPHSYEEQFLSHLNEGPSREFPFGTDQSGHDMLSQVIYGARVSVIIGFSAVAIAAVLSTFVGVVSAYYQGWVDSIMQRLVDVVISFPAIILLITLVSVLAPPQTDRATELWRAAALIVGLGIIIAAGTSRVIRGSAISVRQNQYVEAARALGASDVRIIAQHMLPNVSAVILILSTVQLGTAILAEAAISFLGYGIPDPFPAWGRMLSQGVTFTRDNPWLSVWPGLAIALAVYGFNVFGDALRDVLDPRLRGTF